MHNLLSAGAWWEGILTSASPPTGAFLQTSIETSGVPDGSCVDAEGAVWNAVWEGRRVIRVLPDGTVDQVVEVPTLKPTCCAFGGADLATLYITTSQLGSTPEQLAAEPSAGSLFSFRPGVRGVADAPFAG